MVLALVYRRRDPEGKDRGAGYYYFKGNILLPNGQRKPTWSKYIEELDAHRPHKRKRVLNINQSEKVQPHKADYKTKGRRGNQGRKNQKPSKIKD